MGMPMALDRIYTADEVRAFPEDGNRYELVWGELLVSPTPRALHQLVVERLSAVLRAYCEKERAFFAWSQSADISWGPDTLVNPDTFVVPRTDAATLDWRRMTRLYLAVEVLSPSSVKHDRFGKRKLYQVQGVEETWVVDADEHFVEVWTRDATFPTKETDRLVWTPPGARTPCVIELAPLFAPIEP
jgi:Uma2 family endonuclease